MSLLELKNYSVNYGPISAVKSINLSVDKGEIVAIVGANGAGKSSTLNSVCGIIPKSGGEIIFEGKDISKLSTRERVESGICLVPEGRLVFPEMTILENLEMGFLMNKQKDMFETLKRNVFDYFPRLEERKTQLAGTLSGGEQQMLAIGRGLMSSPKLLMLDEPSLGLAPVIVDEVAKIIKYLNQEVGVSILLVEQNALMALDISNRAYVLETGNVVLSGVSSELEKDENVKKSYLGT